ncbi:MAG: metallopeptidase [Fluviicola sp.]|nr:MAG: metallopeptidase [Fluviicola sp.]
MNKLLASLFITSFFTVFAQDQLDKIDVLNYDVQIELNDNNDSIHVKEIVSIQLLKDCDQFYLDLASINNGHGMKVISAVVDLENPLTYSHQNDTLWITPNINTKGTVFNLTIHYSGIPKTGMIIGENKFGQRTFFGDNWPNRARQWFACVDHPSDKAKMKFTVIAPEKYDCIATGELVSVEKYSEFKNIHSYESNIELPTKVMVIGLAEFDVEQLENKHDFILSTWAYSKDSENGFADMAVAKEVIDFFIANIGTYPFEKLANVQSTTQFGGMENAGNIFYDEGAVTGEQKMENLIAHEIAHQWFGNSASESDWKHLWLSEGFATYFTDLYLENKYGTEMMNERLIGERNRVIKFSKGYKHPVVDTTYESLMDLLNPHSYQKGAWFLHMLRNEVGDSIFWTGVRAYYEKYKYNNASTSDFQEVMESLTSLDLNKFFHQWLYQSGQPKLKIKYKSTCKQQVLKFYQVQKGFIFDFKLEIKFNYDDGTSETKVFEISRDKVVFILDTEKVITGMIYDPNVKLLFEQVEN